MCISAAMLAASAATVGAVGTIYGIDQQRKQANRAAAAQAKAEADAAQTANARLAQRRRALASQSLVNDQGATSGMASAGRTTLGGV